MKDVRLNEKELERVIGGFDPTDQQILVVTDHKDLKVPPHENLQGLIPIPYIMGTDGDRFIG